MSESISTTASATDDGIKLENFEREAVPHLDLLYGYGLRLTGHPQQAEDLVQNTMLKAYRSWHKYQMGPNVRAWLVTILRNCFITEYRKASGAGGQIDVNEIEEFSVFEEVQGKDPEGRFFDQIVDDDILRAIDELPAEYRETLVLSDIEALSYAEIAKVTSVSLGTVKSRLFRARHALRRKLLGYAVAMGYIGQAALAKAC